VERILTTELDWADPTYYRPLEAGARHLGGGAGAAGGVGAGAGSSGGAGGGGGAGASGGTGAGAGAGSGGGGGGYYPGAYGSPYLNRLGTNVFQIQRSQPWFGGGWFGNGTFDSFHQRAPQPGLGRRHATPSRDFHRFQRAQRTNRSLKPHKLVRKMLPDHKPMQSLDARSSWAPPARGNSATAGAPLIKRSADEVQVAPTSVIEKAEPTFGTAPVNRSADVVQVAAPPLIERSAEPISRSRDPLSEVSFAIGMVVVAALGIFEFLSRRTYAKRILAFGAMRRFPPRPENVRRPLSIEATHQTSKATLVPEVVDESEGNRLMRGTVVALDEFLEQTARLADQLRGAPEEKVRKSVTANRKLVIRVALCAGNRTTQIAYGRSRSRNTMN